MGNEAIVEAIDLTKFYGKRCGVNAISFRVEPDFIRRFEHAISGLINLLRQQDQSPDKSSAIRIAS